ncbi:hypothetical protein FD754_008042 [Muntiacus muntjak]|uniref:Ig-like domain-containing protein n=1 Tax=Muntiacus muntjak TaxID=9888 RepID=A0A5N3WUF6_MUNMU|nr:hypothetical protein FD754_008042 [Muntiacus muntjak]
MYPASRSRHTITLWPIAAVEIDTHVLEAADGTDVRLNCTSSCFAPVGDALMVTWNFRPRCGGPNQFPERYDVSILLWKLQFDDNGTYTCQVKNPPDVDGLIREIQLNIYETHLILLNVFQYYRWQVFVFVYSEIKYYNLKFRVSEKKSTLSDDNFL